MDTVLAATDDYRADSDPLGRFLEACTRPQIDRRVQSSEMHALFAAWAKANGEAEWTPKGLAMALKERGVASKKSVNVFWLDIELTKRVSDFLDEHGKPLKDGEMSRAGPRDDEERIYE
jgi:putative DNA primase/helicase